MSEESSTIAPVAEAGEPSFAADGAVTLEGVTFPPVESVPEPAEPPVEATPAAEAAPRAADVPTEPIAAPADPFMPVKLQNGELELRLETGEVFKGKTETELLANIAKSKLESNRYIQELKAKPVAPVTPAPAPTQPEIDPAAQAILDMIAPGLGLKNGQELKQQLQALQQAQSGFTEIQQQQRDNQTAVEFFRTTPDFVATEANIHRLGEALDSVGMPFTLQNARFAHYALKGQGVYEAVPPAPAADVPRTSTGQLAPRANPLPPTGSSPALTGKGTPSEADLYNMPLGDLEALMQSAMAQ